MLQLEVQVLIRLLKACNFVSSRFAPLQTFEQLNVSFAVQQLADIVLVEELLKTLSYPFV